MLRKFAVVVLGLMLCAPALFAANRGVSHRVPPSYPEIAKRMHITGAVKVEVKIGPDGKVLSATVVSGHPMLKDAAVAAAKQYLFENADETSTQVLTFNFNLD
jgi:TonB family protein